MLIFLVSYSSSCSLDFQGAFFRFLSSMVAFASCLLMLLKRPVDVILLRYILFFLNFVCDIKLEHLDCILLDLLLNPFAPRGFLIIDAAAFSSFVFEF